MSGNNSTGEIREIQFKVDVEILNTLGTGLIAEIDIVNGCIQVNLKQRSGYNSDENIPDKSVTAEPIAIEPASDILGSNALATFATAEANVNKSTKAATVPQSNIIKRGFFADKEKLDFLIAAYAEKKTIKSIAATLGCSVDTCTRTLLKLGLKRKPKTSSLKSKRSSVKVNPFDDPKKLQRLIELYNSNVPSKMLGDIFGCNYSMCYRALKSAGIALRKSIRGVTEKERAEIIRLSSEGMLKRELRQKFGYSINTIKQVLQEAGIDRDDRQFIDSAHKSEKLSQKERDAIDKMYNAGFTTVQMMDRLSASITEGQVRYYLKQTHRT